MQAAKPAPAPVQFDDPRRCDGARTPVSNKPVEPCIPCPLRCNPPGKSVFWVTPEARQTPDDEGRLVWGCSTREGFHTADDPRESGPGEPYEARGATAGGLCARPNEQGAQT